MIHSIVLHRPSLSPCISGAIAHAYIKEAPELVWFRTEAEALSCIRNSIESNDRWELSVWDDDKLLGVAIAVPDQDDHVGICLSIQWRFILPEHRGLAGIKLQRAILGLAKRLQYPVVAYTRRTGLGQYVLKYIRIRSHNGQEN